MSDSTRRSYTLEIADAPVTFTSLDDLRFALDSRVQAPADKLEELEPLSTEDLERQAQGIRRVEHKLTRLLGDTFGEPGLLGNAMRELELRLFSEDHAWRSIVAALNARGSDYDDPRRVVLSKYLQYLASRQALIERIYSKRHKRRSDQRQADPGETLLFEVDDLPRSEREASETHVRLPRGEAVRLRMPGEKKVLLYLSVHRFELKGGAAPQLLDEEGKAYPLAPGRISVGRLSRNDVVVDPGFRGVSRRHLIMELGGEGELEIIDLSSHGTFVPRRALADR